MNRSSGVFFAAFSASAFVAGSSTIAACSSDEPSGAPTSADAAPREGGAIESDAASDAGACSDETGSPGACALFLDGGRGLPDGGAKDCLGERSCRNLLTSLEPRVAQRAIECLAAIPECTVDEQIQDCVVKALLTACPDTSGAPACDQGLAGCTLDAGGGITRSKCLQWTAGMTADWRPVFAQCLGTANGCADPRICVPY
jgi:hypothetical protein